MKFAHTLSLNANPDWADHYIDYSSLKKVINEVSASHPPPILTASATTAYRNGAATAMGMTTTPTATATTAVEDVEDPRRQIFLQKLSKMITKARDFYDTKRAELDLQMTRLQRELEVVQQTASSTSLSALGAGAGDDDDDYQVGTELSPLIINKGDKKSRISSNSRNSSKPSKTKSTKMLKNVSALSLAGLEDRRPEICDLFTQYHSLQSFASLNCTAVQKILKKYDKVMNDHLKETHLATLKVMLPFWDGTPELDVSLQRLQNYFAHFYCHGNKEEALRRLQLMVRELVSYQRHSVWLDVIEDQRKRESAQLTQAPILLTTTTTMGGAAAGAGAGAATSIADMEKHKQVLKLIQSSTTLQMALVSLATFSSLLIFPGVFDDDPTKRNALALFVFVSFLWATEVLPLFVTSMLVPFLSVILRVIVVDGTRLDARSASKHVFATMFSHVIMLLIGGFSIAAALSKHNIAKMVASSIAHRCGSGMRKQLLVHLFVATIASMWISNVAAPVLCMSLIAPILKAAQAETSRAVFGTQQQLSAESDRRLCRALVMGIALASNVGGMASPISSPQNLFAIEYTPIGWMAWFVVSIPLCILMNTIIWVWLIYSFQLPSAESNAVAYALQRDRSSSEKFTSEQYYVIAVSVGTVLLWCASVSLESLTGQMGILGIVPFALFFGTGILSKQDLNNFLWSVVILAMGGLVLGEAVKTSGLLDVVAEHIADFIEIHSLSLWSTLCIFTFLILFCTTFVSHTVGAIVVIPIVQAVGTQMQPTSHAKELVFAAALACSAAMGLPVSGFPNMTAASVEDNLGNRFLTAQDFIKYAVPASIFSWGVLVTLGYWLILYAVQVDKI